jgi:hypothetical protein
MACATLTESALGIQPLQIAIASGNVETTRRLLEAGADPSATDSQGRPIVHWLGSGRGYSDDDLLQVAQLLKEHGCRFEDDSAKLPDVLTNLAPRHVPKTLAFLATQPVGKNASQALKAIARSNDAESIQVLLKAGADPSVLPQKNPKPVPSRPVINPNCQPKELTPDMRVLMNRLDLGGMNCKWIQQCGELIYVDCNSAADGPAYYLNLASGQRLATCGGACMAGCKNCPPKEWTCNCNQ